MDSKSKKYKWNNQKETYKKKMSTWHTSFKRQFIFQAQEKNK